MALKRGTRNAKSPPIFSHEFFIQNHADIVSCFAMLIVVGLLFQLTAPLATTFVALQHNATEPMVTPLGTFVSYTSGPRDAAIIFFYFLISVVIHAVVQEYLLDKVTRKLHLSKTKHSKFNESGQQLTFLLFSLLWAAEIIRRDGYLVSVSRLWTDYPARHVEMSYLLKFYFIIQLAYWLHSFPELYFQKVKRDEAPGRALQATTYLAFFGSAYFLNFTRIALCLSTLHYTTESIFHLARLLNYSNKTKFDRHIFRVWNVLFPVARLASISLSVVTFWYGLAATSTDAISLSEGNFNTPFVRLLSLSAIATLQAFLMWNYINDHLRRARERKAEQARRKRNQAAKAAAAIAKRHSDTEDGGDGDETSEVENRETISATPSPVASKPKSQAKLKTK